MIVANLGSIAAIGARKADHRDVTQIGFAPDWTKHGHAAPFSETIRCLMSCQSGSWSSPAPAFRNTSLIRRGSSVSRCGGSNEPPQMASNGSIRAFGGTSHLTFALKFA